MSSIILEAKSLTKEYKQTLALDHINLQIKKGKIYGFIGQNGAGKTTFLRLVTGLAFPTSGTLSLWGNSGTEELQKQRKRIGSMIESSHHWMLCSLLLRERQERTSQIRSLLIKSLF